MTKRIATLAIQVILVIAAVLLFSFIDPFGILAPRKKTLENTPITVVSIKEIGQLVTAEYYGEVLSSLQTARVEAEQAEQAEGKVLLTALSVQYTEAIDSFRIASKNARIHWFRRKKDLLDLFYDANAEMVADPQYQEMVDKIVSKAGYKTEGELLLELKKVSDNDAKTILVKLKLTTADIDNMHQAKLAELKDERKFKKSQIVVIGRGAVKAGIDFGDFSERNFRYDEDKDIIYLFGVSAKILNCDINPWFIPEKKVKGFEIIAATHRANRADYLQEVKEDCLRKLQAQAEQAGLLETARTNAEQSLREFFSLLLVEPVKEVHILENYFEHYRDLFPPNGAVPREKLGLVDSALLALNSISRDSATSLASRLARTTWQDGAERFPMTRYAALAYIVAGDRHLSPEDSARLHQYRKAPHTLIDTLWFLPEARQTVLWNQTRRQALKKRYGVTKSNATYWIDSVSRNDAYQAYDADFQKLVHHKRDSTLQHHRQEAWQQLMDYLTKRIVTVARPGMPVSQHPDSVALFVETFH
jgi:hypothetical protein